MNNKMPGWMFDAHIDDLCFAQSPATRADHAAELARALAADEPPVDDGGDMPDTRPLRLLTLWEQPEPPVVPFDALDSLEVE